MAEVSLVRVDFRLVHGQVVVKWSKVAKATKIIVMNDVIAADKTIKSVYKMAAPAGVKVLCYSLEKGCLLYTSIGSTARYEIEKMLDMQANLKLWVKVKKDWRDSDFLVKNFGYREDE